jgi:hypothetical protein
MRTSIHLLFLLFLFYSTGHAQGNKSMTVAFAFDHNRIIVPVEVYADDGQIRLVKAWLDNGSPVMSITGRLAAELGLPVTADSAGGLVGTHSHAAIAIRGMRLPIAGLPIEVVNATGVGNGVDAEITLSSMLLSRYDLVIDYPGLKLTIGMPGTLRFEGTAVKAFIHPKNALIQIPATMDGDNFHLALDLGTPVSLIDKNLIEKWGNAHPAWPSVSGAIGVANLWGLDSEPEWRLLRVHHLRFGGIDLRSLVAATCPSEWLDYFIKRVGMSTAGLIGAEALYSFRIGIDYAHQTVYFQKRDNAVATTFDCVGLTLRPEGDGSYLVLGVAKANGLDAVGGVQKGDSLLTINDHPVRALTMGAVWSLLSGTPGADCRLSLGRGGKTILVSARVARFLAD